MKKANSPVVVRPIVDPRLLTIKAAAVYLSCHVWALRSLVWKKQIPVVKIGKGYLFDRADLDKFVDQQKGAVA